MTELGSEKVIDSPLCEYCHQHMTPVFKSTRDHPLMAWICEPCVSSHLIAWSNPTGREHKINMHTWERGL